MPNKPPNTCACTTTKLHMRVPHPSRVLGMYHNYRALDICATFRALSHPLWSYHALSHSCSHTLWSYITHCLKSHEHHVPDKLLVRVCTTCKQHAYKQQISPWPAPYPLQHALLRCTSLAADAPHSRDLDMCLHATFDVAKVVTRRTRLRTRTHTHTRAHTHARVRLP